MAKGKNATALFEVIQHDRRIARGEDRRTGGPWETWWSWLSPRPRPRGSTALPPCVTPVASPPSPPTLSPPSQPTYPAVPAYQDPPTPSTAPATLSVSPRPSASPHASGYAAPQRLAMAVDRQRQQISLRLSYSSAIVGAFALAVLLGLAYVVGQHVSRGPTPVYGGRPTAEVRSGPVQAGVLEVDRATLPTTPTPPPAANVRAQAPLAATSAQPLTTKPGLRIIGLNYVIIQAYPDEKMANEAKDFLNKHDILCTVEKGLPAWGSDWYVVGIEPFEKMSKVPAYDAYIKSIENLSGQFAGSSKFKRFAPLPYKWRG